MVDSREERKKNKKKRKMSDCESHIFCATKVSKFVTLGVPECLTPGIM